MMSALLLAAFSMKRGLDAGTASSVRFRRGVHCSMTVKLMMISPAPFDG